MLGNYDNLNQLKRKPTTMEASNAFTVPEYPEPSLAEIKIDVAIMKVREESEGDGKAEKETERDGEGEGVREG